MRVRFAHSCKLARAVPILIAVACSALCGCNATIYDAAAKGDVGRVKALLEKTPELASSKDKDGTTPMQAAVWNDRTEVVALLIAYNADVNAKDYDGWTPLHIAAKHDSKAVAELLVRNKADVNAPNDKHHGWTPLQIAAMGEHTEIAELMGAQRPAKPYEGRPSARDPGRGIIVPVGTPPDVTADDAFSVVNCWLWGGHIWVYSNSDVNNLRQVVGLSPTEHRMMLSVLDKNGSVTREYLGP